MRQDGPIWRHSRGALVIGAAIALGVAVPATAAGPDVAGFSGEMALAAKARDRDSKLRHLRKALSYRPDHPDNIAIEFRIAVLLSQVADPRRGQFPQREEKEEALTILEGIVRKYDHMHYYRSELPETSHSPQTLVPSAALLAASMQRGLRGDKRRAREYLWRAMQCVEMTYARRKNDWASAPPPEPPRDPRWLDDRERAAWKTLLSSWEEQRRKAAKGDVLDTLEMAILRDTVRQYGYTFGRQRPHEVALAMSKIIRGFPGTPMAKVAQEHIDRADRMMLADILADIAEDEFTEVVLLDEHPGLLHQPMAPPKRVVKREPVGPATPRRVSTAPVQHEQPRADRGTGPVVVWLLGPAALVALVAVYLMVRRRHGTVGLERRQRTP